MLERTEKLVSDQPCEIMLSQMRNLERRVCWSQQTKETFSLWFLFAHSSILGSERRSPVFRLQIRSACGVENVIPIAGSSRHVDLGLNHMRTISMVCREEALRSNVSMPEGHASSRETRYWFEGDQYPHGK